MLFILKAQYAYVFLLDGKLLPMLTVWLKRFIDWLRV